MRVKKSVGADWRTDLRIKTTSNPLDPVYREWNHREIWDLITLDGNGADPRDVPFKIEWHNSPAGAPPHPGECAVRVPRSCMGLKR